MVSNNLFQSIYKKHEKYLKHIGRKTKKKILICFSGIPGSGKTTIAKVIEKRYRMVRINSHRIGKIIRELQLEGIVDKDIDIPKMQIGYCLWLLKQRPFRSTEIIFDMGIDRKHKEILSMAKLHGFDLVVIRVITSMKTIRKRIKNRNKEDSDVYFKELKRWEKEFKEFANKNKADITLDNNLHLVLEPLYTFLDSRLPYKPRNRNT